MRVGMRRSVAQTFSSLVVCGAKGKAHGTRRICAGFEPSCFLEMIDSVAPRREFFVIVRRLGRIHWIGLGWGWDGELHRSPGEARRLCRLRCATLN